MIRGEFDELEDLTIQKLWFDQVTIGSGQSWSNHELFHQ
jgi:hypothetical protein